MSFDAGGGPGGIDPSSLHLKKELTQIRKAARVLRDPGTSSSSRRRRPTPLTKHHYVHHRRIDGNEITIPSFPHHSNADDTSNDDSNPASDDPSNKGNVSVVGTEKRVFLCNWRSQSKKSEVRDDEEESFLSSSSKSEAYFKNKPKRSSGSNYRISVPKPKKRILSTSSLVDQSDEDYLNSEDITSRASAISPLLARFNKIQGRALSLKREEDSISYSNKYGVRYPSTVGSWNSLNDVDDEVDEEQQGCGIPCYNWSKRSTPKSRFGYGSGSCGSPSIPDSLRRKGSSIFSRTQSIHHRRRSGQNKRTPTSKIPLLTSDDDDLAANFEELDLEALSRLDRKRWSSSCRSQEGLKLVVVDDREEEEESSPENARSLSHKYRPVFFEELVGQDIVIQSLRSSISRKRISPVYLFHGPRGTGKTAAARIFATALNCLASEENNNNNNNIKPCGVCRECTDSISGKSENIIEVDGSNKVGIDKIKSLLSSLSVGRDLDFSQFKVFVVDECHLLPSKMWLGFLRLAEKPLPNVIFVLVTTDVDNLPRSVLSRCQKHLFSKIENSDIVARLRKIGENEDLDVDTDALEMIAMNVDGSLRDAETMLDQLSLFGKRIEASLVNELIGVVSDEKLLELLGLAMSSNATETVIRSRELLDSGVDPIVLMSQMATLIVDIIAGTYPGGDEMQDSFFGGKDLSGQELDRLKHALNLLSEAEKHLRVSSEQSTWFTATLLQLGSVGPSNRAHSGSSSRQSSKATEDDCSSLKSSTNNNNRVPTNCLNSSRTQFSGSPVVLKDESKNGRSINSNSKMLDNIWAQCVEKCHSKTLRELLHVHGRIVSISEVKGGFVAHIGFNDPGIKSRAEGFLSSITNSFEIVLRHNVEVKLACLPNSFHMDKNTPENNSAEGRRRNDPSETESRNANVISSKGAKPGIPGRRIESIIHEQRLETAWLQALDNKGTPRSAGRMKPERNQVLPQDGPNESGPLDPLEDELNSDIKDLRVSDRMVGSRRSDHFPISPSLLHNSKSLRKFSSDKTGYESGSGPSGCGAMFCWNNSRPERSREVQNQQGKQGTARRGYKSSRFSWFGECAKPRRGSRYTR